MPRRLLREVKQRIFRHTKSSRDETVSCGFRQPNHKIDFLGHITARRALICDARVILAKRSSDLHHLTAREPRTAAPQRDQPSPRKSAAHAHAAAMAAFNQNFQQPPQQQFQQQSSGFPHGGDYASGGSGQQPQFDQQFQFNLGEDPTWGAQAQPTQYTSNGFNQPTPNGGAFYARRARGRLLATTPRVLMNRPCSRSWAWTSRTSGRRRSWF